MSDNTRKLVTIITESSLEMTLTRDIERLGGHGYTISDARGKGSRGVRDAGWDASSNIRVEVICNEQTAQAIIGHCAEKYYDNYAMVIYSLDVAILRPAKF